MESTTIQVPAELFACAESSSFAGTYDLREFTAGPDTYVFEEPLQWNVSVTNTSGALLVMGTVTGTASTECGRCLETFKLDIDGEVEGYFVIEGGEKPDDEMEEDEFEILDPEGKIDLVPLLQAAIVVDLPLLPLCREDCAGICQDCGINLNEGSCGCAAARAERDREEQAAANPFAALAGLNLEADQDDQDASEE